jgi:hypothetical protein
MKYASGDKERSKGGEKQDPFPEFQELQKGVDTICTYFVHSPTNRADLKSLCESLGTTSEKRIEAGVNKTRIEANYFKIRSILEHREALEQYSLQVAMKFQFSLY